MGHDAGNSIADARGRAGDHSEARLSQ
jgi:hypothetical protein